MTDPQPNQLQRLVRQLRGAIAFYTILPVPPAWPLEFSRIARWAPLIGLLIGAGLGVGDKLLQVVGIPNLTRSALVVGFWIAITGGLHLDGAMDTADGLAVQDPERRLAVMADSRSGAFGVMSAIALFMLKTTAMSELESCRTVALMAAAGWGRWGQLLAVARYAYLKPTGKGAIHKATIRPWDLLPGLLLLLGFSSLLPVFLNAPWTLAVGIVVSGSAIAWRVAAWFNFKLGGHTGDTYGATVEWVEALVLCFLTALSRYQA